MSNILLEHSYGCVRVDLYAPIVSSYQTDQTNVPWRIAMWLLPIGQFLCLLLVCVCIYLPVFIVVAIKFWTIPMKEHKLETGGRLSNDYKEAMAGHNSW